MTGREVIEAWAEAWMWAEAPEVRRRGVIDLLWDLAHNGFTIMPTGPAAHWPHAEPFSVTDGCCDVCGYLYPEEDV